MGPIGANKDSSEKESYHKGTLKNSISSKQSAPTSAKSRSSESSGYISSRGEKNKRYRGPDTSSYAAGTVPAPLRKLAHTNSTSSLKVQSNRSSSCLTSK